MVKYDRVIYSLISLCTQTSIPRFLGLLPFQALPYVVVKADGENGQRDSPGLENSSSPGPDAAVSSSTPGGHDRDNTASPNPAKKDDKDGAKSRASSREKDAPGAAGDATSEGRRMTRRAAAAAATTGTESVTGVADSSSNYIVEESGSNGERFLPQPPRKRKPRGELGDVVEVMFSIFPFFR